MCIVTEYGTSLRCAHCKSAGTGGGDCKHPLGFRPPFTECGATPAKCGSLLLMTYKFPLGFVLFRFNFDGK